MIKLTNAEAAYSGRAILINPAHIISVFEAYDEERRVQTIDGQQYIVSQTIEEIVALIAWVSK